MVETINETLFKLNKSTGLKLKDSMEVVVPVGKMHDYLRQHSKMPQWMALVYLLVSMGAPVRFNVPEVMDSQDDTPLTPDDIALTDGWVAVEQDRDILTGDVIFVFRR